MAGKKQYYELDEIGFVGTQDKRSYAQVKKDIEKTIQYIKTKKTGKNIPLSRKRPKRLSKVK
ncbi:MAG TPA: hypothetical protein VK625_07985 [Flavitalea sp.]|nr:hypothetical protein [Flavitalea sp.]